MARYRWLPVTWNGVPEPPGCVMGKLGSSRPGPTSLQKILALKSSGFRLGSGVVKVATSSVNSWLMTASNPYMVMASGALGTSMIPMLAVLISSDESPIWPKLEALSAHAASTTPRSNASFEYTNEVCLNWLRAASIGSDVNDTSETNEEPPSLLAAR